VAVAGGGFGAPRRWGARGAKRCHDLHGQAITKARILAPIHRSAWRDCLETPDRLHLVVLVVPRACTTGERAPFSALRAADKRAIRPVQLFSRPSLERLSGNSG
jgi:hypothetical protein